MSVRKSRGKYRQIYGKSKASLWRNLSAGTPPNFFRTILCFVALFYNWCFFFRTAVLRKLFDLRFSYKHRNFSRVCLLLKMASKTVTRSIVLWSWLEWILQNQVSARRLELNKTIFRQITPTLHDLVVFKEISIQRLKKAKMRMVSPKYVSKPTYRLVVFHVLFVRI